MPKCQVPQADGAELGLNVSHTSDVTWAFLMLDVGCFQKSWGSKIQSLEVSRNDVS